jgi:hypothetical protein
MLAPTTGRFVGQQSPARLQSPTDGKMAGLASTVIMGHSSFTWLIIQQPKVWVCFAFSFAFRHSAPGAFSGNFGKGVKSKEDEKWPQANGLFLLYTHTCLSSLFAKFAIRFRRCVVYSMYFNIASIAITRNRGVSLNGVCGLVKWVLLYPGCSSQSHLLHPLPFFFYFFLFFSFLPLIPPGNCSGFFVGCNKRRMTQCPCLEILWRRCE